MSFITDLLTGTTRSSQTSTSTANVTPAVPFGISTGRSTLGITGAGLGRRARRGRSSLPLGRFGLGPGRPGVGPGGFGSLLNERLFAFPDGGRLPTASLSLDPSIQAGLDNSGGLASEFLDSARGLTAGVQGTSLLPEVNDFLARLRGNESPFIDARVRPLEERLAGIAPGIERDFARRGIFGTLREREVARAQEAVAREIGDARALATQDALNAELSGLGLKANIDANEFTQALSALGLEGEALSRVRQNTIDQLTVELAALGVSQDAIDSFLNSRIASGGTTTTSGRTGDSGQALSNIGKLLLLGGVFGGVAGGIGGGALAGGAAAGGALGAAAAGGGAAAACWVAREVFQDSRWILFREWLLNCAPEWFRNLYLKYGEQTALYISNKPKLKADLEVIMNHIIRSRHG